MRTRYEIKAQARNLISSHYGQSVLPFLFYMLITAAAGTIVPGIGGVFMLPVMVGMYLSYTLLVRGEIPSYEVMFQSAFNENYLRKLGGMVLMGLYTFLWGLLFIIPGIVKSYSYALTPYILANHPDVEADRAVSLSCRLMYGHKMDLFIQDLSFIGWHIIGMITFGILNILWVLPYQTISRTAFLEDVMKASEIDL